jgi:cyclin H
MADKILATIEKCAEMLNTVPAFTAESAEEKKKARTLSKKLTKCRNPEKMDLVGLQRAKREGDGEDEKIVKKRKLEREQSAKTGEDLFGPALGKQ